MKSLFYSLTGSCILLCACSNEPNPVVASQKSEETAVSESVIKPIEGLETKIRIFSVSATEASTINLPNGGSIEFPSNAFVDENGNSVNGKVDIEWQEYHSLTDIMLSGVPMKYDSAGVNHDFVSGGMFTIDAKQGDKQVDLADGKSATVNLASYNDTPCFNFYTLNEKTGDWSYETTKNGEPLNEEKAVEPKKETSTNELLDVKMDVSAFPELKNEQIVAWKLNEKLDAKSKNVLKNNATAINLTKNEADYTITFNHKKESISVNVKPYTMNDALADKKGLMTKMESDVAELMKYQDNFERGKLVRSIEIPGMGTYNWDKVLKRKTEVLLAASYNFNRDVNPQFVSLYFISPKENVAISCNPNGDAKLKFDPSLSNYLVAIMPDNSVLVANNSEFKNASSSKNVGAHTFSFENLNLTVKSPEDLGKVLQDFMRKNS